jgi:nickel-dependent lactate racemase
MLLERVAGLPVLSDCDFRAPTPADPAPIDLARALPATVAHPRGSSRLADLARGRAGAVIVTSDATRAVPNRQLLPLVVAELNAAGMSDDDIEVVIGTGAHRGATKGELRDMLGPEWVERLRVTNHDARGDVVSVGATSRGNEVLVNRRVMDAGVRIALGLVEPHEFAGFTGGPKAILPAVSGYDTILRNHSLAMMRHPLARPGVLEGNPIHEEMAEAVRLARLEFAVNVVLDSALRPVAVAAGDPLVVQAEMAAFVRAQASVALAVTPHDEEGGDAPDIVVTGPGRPLDINLYQSIKPLVAIEPLVDDQTQVVLVSRCWDGIGSAEMFEPFAGRASAADVLAGLDHAYTIEKDHAFFIARFLQRCPNVIACCPGVADDHLRRLGFEPAATVEEAVGRGRARRPPAPPLVYLLPRPQRALFTATAAPAAGRDTQTERSQM